MKTLTEGDAFGDYRVVRRLGKGGMGEVWLLRSSTGTEVAAKLLDEASSADHAARKRFLREAELAMGVKHPNLVETYDVGEDPDTGLCYILMEYMPGGTLADYLKFNGALDIDDAVAVVSAMATVLELARQKGIVHRDIKPANIMFDLEGTPKLADLGIARRGTSDETTTLTQMGVMIGTPAYMAPEQMLDAHHVDTRADIYSLGVVFYEMLTGERPNKDDTVVQILARAVKGEPIPDVRNLRPEVSASLAQLLNMMVVPDKDGRISTPGQITNAIDIIVRTDGFDLSKATVKMHAAGGVAKPRALLKCTWVKLARVWKAVSWKTRAAIGILAGVAMVFFVLAYIEASSGPKVARPIGEGVAPFASPTTSVQTVVSQSAVESPLVPDANAIVQAQVDVAGKAVEKVQQISDYAVESPVPQEAQVVVQTNLVEIVQTNVVEKLVEKVRYVSQPVFNEPVSNEPDTNVSKSVESLETVAKVDSPTVGEKVATNEKPGGSDADKGETFSAERLKGRTPRESVQLTLDALFPGWGVSRNYNLDDDRSGFLESKDGEENVLVTLPPARGVPLEIFRRVSVPKENPVLHVRVSNHSQESQFRLCISVGSWKVREQDIKDGWTDVYVDLSRWRGKAIEVCMEQIPTGWHDEWAYWSKIEILSDKDAVESANRQKLEPEAQKFALHAGLRKSGELKEVLASLLPRWSERPLIKGFKETGCYDEEYLGRYNIVRLHWLNQSASISMIGSSKSNVRLIHPALSLTVAGDGLNPCKVKVVYAGTEIFCETVVAREWSTFEIDLVAKTHLFQGNYRQPVPLKSMKIEFAPAHSRTGCAYIADLSIDEKK